MVKNEAMTDDKFNNEKEKTPSARVIRSPLFNKTYSTNVLVSVTDTDVRMEFMNEKFKDGDDAQWIYYSDHLTILSMQAAKKLYVDLGKKLSKYETENGEIQVSEERAALDADL